MMGIIEALRNHIYAPVPCWVREIPDHLKTQEICDEAVRIEPRSLEFIPDHLKPKGCVNEPLKVNQKP